MKYEVRCCCDPGKLLGWVDGPEDARQLSFGLCRPFSLDAQQDPVTITLPVARIFIEGRGYFSAVKAEGVGIDVLRQVLGFVEAE